MSGQSDTNQAEIAEIKELVKKAKKGDQAAFTALYDLFFEKIFKFIYFRVNHKETAEDLAEDVFIKAWTKIQSHKGESFSGWLYRIAKNSVIDYYRQKKSTVDIEEISNILEADDSLLEYANTVIEQRLMIKFLKELTPEQQIIIKLKFLEDLDNQEIAELISKSEGAIRVIQHRAIQRLQELVKNFIKNSGSHANSPHQ